MMQSPMSMMSGMNGGGATSGSSSAFLPNINVTVETLRLVYGSFMRLCLHSTVYYGSRGFIAEKVLRKKGAMESYEREGICYILSIGAEIGVSMLIMPVRYLAAITTPRFILDYMFTSWSDCISILDRFNPGCYASYALYAFTNTTDDWNLDFFAWQTPSLILSIGKLLLRRRRVGAAQCRTKRVLGMLGLQVLLRAYMASFSVMIPEQWSEAVEAVVVTFLEGIVTSYLIRHTWPFPLEDVPETITTTSTTGVGSEDHDTSTTGDTSLKTSGANL